MSFSNPGECDDHQYLLDFHFDESIYRSKSAVTPLYDGAHLTVLQATAKYFDWFSSHPGTSKEALSDVLHIQKDILPHGNLLPDNYESALSIIQPYLVKTVVFHVCKNECVIFRNEHADSILCPECGSPRYKRKAIPERRFIYMPLGPRLERMFGTSNLSQIVQAHSSRVKMPGVMYDIHDSPSWKALFSPEGIFKGDKRGVAFSLCTDGVNPFSVQRISYSMWPIMVTLLNLPRDIRNNFSNILLVGIIPPNGTQEPKSLQPYLGVLVDELLLLSNAQMYDAYQKAPFSFKVNILTYVLDYPGIAKTFNLTGSGSYRACVWCDIKG